MFLLQALWVQFLVGELRPHMLQKKKKKIRKNSFSYVSTGFLAGGSFQGKFRGGPPFKQFFLGIIYISLVFSGDSDSKESTCNAGDLGLIPGSGRSPEREMATHSTILAWRIPWTEEPSWLQSMGLQRI